jgi:ribosomal protein S18 acetylase RimI-like enzyme
VADPLSFNYSRTVIRRFRSGDRAWVQAVAGHVYGDLGDYARILPTWLEHRAVFAYVEESDSQPRLRRGFVLLGFHDPPEGPAGCCVADLLALAVAPRFQRRGIGRALLRHAIRVAEVAGRDGSVTEMRLTVADGNAVGQHLYLSSGFRVLDRDHGHYDGGQRAIRMARPLSALAVAAHG